MVKRGCWVVIAIVMVLGCKKSGDDPIAQFRTGGSAAATGSATGSATAATTTPTGSAAVPAGSAAATPAVGSATAAAGSATTGSAAGSAAVAEGFKVGDPVLGQWTDGDWYPGKIGKINDDGTYRVNYSDGDVSPSLPAKKVRPRKASSSGKSSSASASKGGAEPCPASHWTRCPDGNCHPLMDDGWNCGACGHSCPRNMSLCRNGTCDCSTYEKDANGGVCPPP